MWEEEEKKGGERVTDYATKTLALDHTTPPPSSPFYLRGVIGGGAVGRRGAHKLAHAMAEGGDVCLMVCMERIGFERG